MLLSVADVWIWAEPGYTLSPYFSLYWVVGSVHLLSKVEVIQFLSSRNCFIRSKEKFLLYNKVKTFHCCISCSSVAWELLNQHSCLGLIEALDCVSLSAAVCRSVWHAALTVNILKSACSIFFLSLQHSFTMSTVHEILSKLSLEGDVSIIIQTRKVCFT